MKIAAFIICAMVFSAWRIMPVTSLDPAEYIKWVENEKNGLNITKQAGDYKFSMQYKPLEYIVLKENTNQKTDKTSIEKRKSEINGMQYFNLRISMLSGEEVIKAGITDKDSLKTRKQYFEYGMQNNIKLIDGADTLPCLMYHFEMNYGLVNFNNINLAFNNAANANDINDKTILFEVAEIGIERIEIVIKKSSIYNLPLLNID